ncbi:MAG: hypothetical protein LBL63_05915 [Clostridiales Family XIII bacterium]|jgi:hypothetical protein|nr:hypothetical protein [Clostridiales Family XIII bacterium]
MRVVRVGVKFCGGCNPRYDRNAAYEEIRDHFAAGQTESARDAVFEYAEEGASYDLLLVVGGCANCCASTEGYDVGGTVVVAEAGQVRRAIGEIERALG